MIYHNSITTIFKLKSVDNRHPSSCVIPITPITRKLLINQINENIQSQRQIQELLPNSNIWGNNLCILIKYLSLPQDPKRVFNLAHYLALLEPQSFNEVTQLYMEALSGIPYCCICNMRNYLPEDIKDQNERKNNIIQLLPKPFCDCIDCINEYRWYLILFITLSLYHLCRFIEDTIQVISNRTDITKHSIADIFLDMMLLKRVLQAKCVKNRFEYEGEMAQNLMNGQKKIAIGQLFYLCFYMKLIIALNNDQPTADILQIEQSKLLTLKEYFQTKQDLWHVFQHDQCLSNKQINQIKKLIDQQKDNQTTLNTKDITKILFKINEY